MVLSTVEVIPVRGSGSSTLLGEDRGGQTDHSSLPAHRKQLPPVQDAQRKLIFRWGSKFLHPLQLLNL